MKIRSTGRTGSSLETSIKTSCMTWVCTGTPVKSFQGTTSPRTMTSIYWTALAHLNTSKTSTFSSLWMWLLLSDQRKLRSTSLECSSLQLASTWPSFKDLNRSRWYLTCSIFSKPTSTRMSHVLNGFSTSSATSKSLRRTSFSVQWRTLGSWTLVYFTALCWRFSQVRKPF